uniref:CCA tRNA nucleotidyltransferase n=1 Tax=Pararhizobium sp. IMCC3301 TaxID=3067904 RepID=UPI0027407E22|nr:CCA tRNA nucleotidyltransferase [Pararhizobium sp. IMCC3301]
MTRCDTHKALFQETFLHEKQLCRLMRALGGGADQVRVVGGAVRNALRGLAVSDLDLACVHPPNEVMKRAAAAGFKTVPTGIDHGTVTVVGNGTKYEVTTLREDIETDGRRAIVRFGTDWQHDMERRDFTMNALSVDRDGVLYDLVAGLDDCLRGRVRFIGTARQRIAEDALRILRFFRFSAHYGEGMPDAEGLAASLNNLQLLDQLSAERIQREIKKLLSAPRPAQLSTVMKAANAVLTQLHLGVEGADFAALAKCDRVDWSLRAVVLWKQQRDRLLQTVRDLKFSKAEIGRLETLFAALEFLEKCGFDDAFQIRLAAYHFGPDVADEVAYLASRPVANCDEQYSAWAKPLKDWQVPLFPVKAADLKQQGLKPGPEMGRCLKALETIWIEGLFVPSRAALLEKMALSMKKESRDG